MKNRAVTKNTKLPAIVIERELKTAMERSAKSQGLRLEDARRRAYEQYVDRVIHI